MADLTGSLIVWLRAALTPEVVVSQVPRIRPGSFVVVRRIGGPFDPPVMDLPTVSVEAYGATQSEAYDLLQRARARIWSLRGQTINGIAVYRVEEFAGPAWLPDPETEGTARYVATFSIRHREHLAVT